MYRLNTWVLVLRTSSHCPRDATVTMHPCHLRPTINYLPFLSPPSWVFLTQPFNILSFISFFQETYSKNHDLKTTLFFLCKVAGGEIQKYLLPMELGEKVITSINSERKDEIFFTHMKNNIPHSTMWRNCERRICTVPPHNDTNYTW